MGLSSVLSASRNSLRVTAGQFGTLSTNMSGAANPNYVHRSVRTQMIAGGGVYGVLMRDDNPVLLKNYLSKSSVANGYNTLNEGLKRLDSIYNADEYASSPRQLLSEFHRTLQDFANDPSSETLGNAAILKAKTLIDTLHHGAKEVQQLRQDADQDIAASVKKINDLLGKLSEVENEISRVKDQPELLYSYQDQRDEILKGLSEEITINVDHKADGSVSVYAANGITLFDRVARKVTFEQTKPLSPGKEGQAVCVDGVPLTHSTFVSPNGGGHLGSLLEVRDHEALLYGKQLDNIAHALVDMFQKAPDGTALKETLFVTKGDGKDLNGLAGRIEVNDAFVSEEGGKATLLGDKKTIQYFVDAFKTERNFDKKAGLSDHSSILNYSDESISWVSSRYKDVSATTQEKATMFVYASNSLSNATGVNTDQELALMIQLQQNYGAATKLLTTVSKMMDDILNAVH